MALVKNLAHLSMDRNAVHEEVDATCSVFSTVSGPVLQVDTYGRKDRAIPGKKSQSIQINADGAERLYAILKETFHLK